MKPPVLYLLETLFCSGLFLAVYHLWLAGRVPYRWCRFYLILTTLSALVIPALDIPVYPGPTVYVRVPVVQAEMADIPAAVPLAADLSGVAPGMPEGIEAPVAWALWTGRTIAALYGAVVLLSLACFVRRVASVRRLRRCSELTRLPRYTLAENPSISTPFTFLRTIFLGPGYTDGERRQIICHEASHVRHRHSLERIVMELMRCLCWFNPFVWMAARSLNEVQEWEADREVLAAGFDLTQYRTVIFRQLFGYRPDITCGLNHSFTKKRFLMMTQFNGGKYTLARFGALIPVVAGMMMLCSFTVRESRMLPADPPAAVEAEGWKIDADSCMSENGYTLCWGNVRLHDSDVLFTCDKMVIHPDGSYELRGNVQGVRDGNVSHTERVVLRADENGRIALNSDRMPTAAADSSETGPAEEGRTQTPRAAEMRTIEIVAPASPSAKAGYLLDGAPATLDDIERELAALPAEKKKELVVEIAPRQDATMEAVTDLKDALRRARVYRVLYRDPAERGFLERTLPPVFGDDGVVTVLDIPVGANSPGVRKFDDGCVAVKERNLFLVSLNGRNKISAGQLGRMKPTELADLKRMVGDFLRNEADNPELSEKVAKEIALPDGSVWSYPESYGVVIVQTTGDASYSAYLDLQRTLTAAFAELRDRAARERFGCGYADLAPGQREAVDRAVPVRISEAERRP